MLHARQAELRDALLLTPRLRPEDRDEIEAASGKSPFCALLEGIFPSVPALSIVDEAGTVMGIYGVIPIEQHFVGAIWMLAATELLEHSRQFLRESRAWIDTLQSCYPVLFNVVDARNTTHIRWLKWCGFTFIKLHEDYGPQHRPFYEFIRIKTNV